jgi:ketosteroid isomerase-like protein
VELQPYDGPWEPGDRHANFKAEVAAYTRHDPLPTIETLSRSTGIPVPALVRYVLVKYAVSGAEALLAMTPIVFRQMEQHVARAEAAGTDAARLEAYQALRQMVAWLAAGEAERARDAGDPAAEVLAAEREWVEAHRRLDLAALDRLMADDYAQVQSDGRVIGKAEALASYVSGKRRWDFAESDDYDLRLYGETAVLMGRWQARGVNAGQAFDYAARFTAVYVKRSGGWQLAADHATELMPA